MSHTVHEGRGVQVEAFVGPAGGDRRRWNVYVRGELAELTRDEALELAADLWRDVMAGRAPSANGPGGAPSHRDNAAELRRRITTEAGLALPTPHVSTEVALLLADLYSELMACVLELELLRAISAVGD